jgi:hypothetical protein
MNSVILIGNLTTDVELRDLGTDKRLAKFGLAVDRGGKDSETDFFRVSVWDRQAQLCADYLAKDGRKRERSEVLSKSSRTAWSSCLDRPAQAPT